MCPQNHAFANQMNKQKEEEFDSAKSNMQTFQSRRLK